MVAQDSSGAVIEEISTRSLWGVVQAEVQSRCYCSLIDVDCDYVRSFP